MNIESKKGDKVVFTGEGGYEIENEYARKHLTIGYTYTVDYTIIGGFDTRVILEEEPDKKFNSVMFDDDADAKIYHSELIESLFNKEPNRSDYADDQQYIGGLIEYIERLKKDHAIESEMYEIAFKEDQESIKNQNKLIDGFMDWYNTVPFGNDKPIELTKCDSCDGTGEKHDYEERKYYKCDGTGMIDKRKLWQKIVDNTKSW